MEFGLIFRNKTAYEKMKINFILAVGFLVVAHVAMILGMVNPEIISKMSAMPKM
nr:DUF6803 family protein [Clostridium rhizosphaerae]